MRDKFREGPLVLDRRCGGLNCVVKKGCQKIYQAKVNGYITEHGRPMLPFHEKLLKVTIFSF